MKRAAGPSRRSDARSSESKLATTRRVFSAWAAFFLFFALLWIGTPALIPLYLGLSTVAIFEYAAMLRLRNIRVHRTVLLVTTVAHVPAALPAGHPLSLAGWLPMAPREALALIVVLVVMTIAIRRPHRDALTTVGFTLLGYLWIPAFFSYLLALRATPEAALGFATVLLPALSIIASDVGGWWIGRSLGRRKLSRELSPDKTIEGAFGGLALAAVVTPVGAWILMTWGPGSPLAPAWAIPFGVLLAFTAQVGDLFESLVKRWAGVKDAGLFLPGQGGVLDRIDSHLFAMPVAYLVFALTGKL